MNFKNYFLQGLKNTLRVSNGIQFSYKGPWTIVADTIVIDEWHVGDFMSADYTIAVDLNTGTKEIIKCLLVASPYDADLTIYGRTSLVNNIINLSAAVDSSRVYLSATPASPSVSGSKVIFSANYYQTVNELQP